MKTRLYDFVSGIEASTQPDAGTPTLSNDLVTKGYADATYGFGILEIQEVPTGLVNNSNVTYTLSQTPASAAKFRLYVDGGKQILGTDFTRSGVTITMLYTLDFAQTIEADYAY